MDTFDYTGEEVENMLSNYRIAKDEFMSTPLAVAKHKLDKEILERAHHFDGMIDDWCLDGGNICFINDNGAGDRGKLSMPLDTFLTASIDVIKEHDERLRKEIAEREFARRVLYTGDYIRMRDAITSSKNAGLTVTPPDWYVTESGIISTLSAEIEELEKQKYCSFEWL
jgi:hypothetical protein